MQRQASRSRDNTHRRKSRIMRTQDITWAGDAGIRPDGPALADADLVLYFGNRTALAGTGWFADLHRLYPRAIIAGCSSGGQIADCDVNDDQLVGVAVRFESTRLRSAEVMIAEVGCSRTCGNEIGSALKAGGLAGILVLSDGLGVNGSELVAGISDILGQNIPICGGLAGDGSDFITTLVGLNGPPTAGRIAAIGFYGTAISIGHGSCGGWDVFGPSRAITRSDANVLIELDGQPALDLYERYLGPDDINGLPGTALLYPLLIRNPACTGQDLVRTVLSIDRKARTMTFAGDMPRGWTAQLMRSSFENLAAGAATAARMAVKPDAPGNGLALLISCIGRRLMLGQRTVDEIEAACESLPASMTKLGFYSYGEISPHSITGCCELHNQTMTVMTLSERAA